MIVKGENTSTNSPFDDLVRSKGRGLTTRVGRIEFSTVNKSAGVMTQARSARLRMEGAISLPHNFVAQTGRESYHIGQFRFHFQIFCACLIGGSDSNKNR